MILELELIPAYVPPPGEFLKMEISLKACSNDFSRFQGPFRRNKVTTLSRLTLIPKMELEARGWTQKDFAEIINKPQQAISEIVKGKKRLLAEFA